MFCKISTYFSFIHLFVGKTHATCDKTIQNSYSVIKCTDQRANSNDHKLFIINDLTRNPQNSTKSFKVVGFKHLFLVKSWEYTWRSNYLPILSWYPNRYSPELTKTTVKYLLLTSNCIMTIQCPIRNSRKHLTINKVRQRDWVRQINIKE